MKRAAILILALALVCGAGLWAWRDLTGGDGEAQALRTPASEATPGRLDDAAAASVFRAFLLNVAADDPDAACELAAYDGRRVSASNHLDECRAAVASRAGALSGTQRTLLTQALTSADYETRAGRDGSVDVQTSAATKTFSATVIDVDREALVDVSSLSAD